jgi:hypothetical protein
VDGVLDCSEDGIQVFRVRAQAGVTGGVLSGMRQERLQIDAFFLSCVQHGDQSVLVSILVSEASAISQVSEKA